jgi:hypothetical protein
VDAVARFFRPWRTMLAPIASPVKPALRHFLLLRRVRETTQPCLPSRKQLKQRHSKSGLSRHGNRQGNIPSSCSSCSKAEWVESSEQLTSFPRLRPSRAAKRKERRRESITSFHTERVTELPSLVSSFLSLLPSFPPHPSFLLTNKFLASSSIPIFRLFFFLSSSSRIPTIAALKRIYDTDETITMAFKVRFLGRSSASSWKSPHLEALSPCNRIFLFLSPFFLVSTPLFPSHPP